MIAPLKIPKTSSRGSRMGSPFLEMLPSIERHQASFSDASILKAASKLCRRSCAMLPFQLLGFPNWVDSLWPFQRAGPF